MKARDAHGQEFKLGEVVELWEPIAGSSYEGFYTVEDIFESDDGTICVDLESTPTTENEPLSIVYGYAAEFVEVVRGYRKNRISEK